MLEGQFGSLGKFIRKRYKVIIIIWIVSLVILLPFTAKSIGVTNYNVQFSGTSDHSMSSQAQALMSSQFGNSSNGSSNGTVVVLFVESPFESPSSYSVWTAINSSYESNLTGIGVTGIVSPYTIANSVVDSLSSSSLTIYKEVSNASNSSIAGFRLFNSSLNGISSFVIALKTVDFYYNSTYHNISYAVFSYSSLFSSYNAAIDNVSALIYGVPTQFFAIYSSLPSYYSVPHRDVIAKQLLLNNTANLGNNQTALSYFGLFYQAWNNSTYYNSSLPQYYRLNNSITQAFNQFANYIPPGESELFNSVYSGFNVTSFSNNSTRESITLRLLYSLTYSYGSGNPYIFNATYENFISKGNDTLLSETLTGSILNSSDSRISTLTTLNFNMTPVQFSIVFGPWISVNDSLLQSQLNESSLAPSIVNLYQSFDIPPSVFYRSILTNDTYALNKYFVDFTASKLTPLSSALNQNSTEMVKTFLSEGSKSSALIYSSAFLKNHFAGYPYFSFVNPEKFVNMSLSSGGNISKVLEGNYSNSGIALNAALFRDLVPNDFSGYLVILKFSQSSLSGAQLDTLNSYIANIQIAHPASKIYFTSGDEISHGIESTAYSGLMFSLIIGIIISIIIVGIYFRSILLAFVPLIFFGVSFSITLGIVYIIFGMIEKTTLSFIVTTLSSILILGLSTDYSVYMLNRYLRESSGEKIETTVRWAGHAVFTSGVTVILSYVVLAIFNVPIIGDGGFVNALGIAISLGVALTLLPSFIILLSKRMKPRKTLVSFTKVAKVSRNHRKALVALLVVIFVATVVVYETTPTSFDLFSLIPNNPGKAGYYEMTAAFGGDYLSPSYVLLTFPSQVYQDGHFNHTDIGIIDKVSSALLNYSAVAQIQTVTYPFGEAVNLSSIGGSALSAGTILNQSLSYIGRDGSTILINVTTKHVSYTQQGIDEISHIDEIVKQATPSGVSYLVGGSAQGLLDSSNNIDLTTYKIVEILAVIIFLVLAFQLTSLFTPLRLLFNVGTSALLAVAIFYAVFHYIMNLPIIVFGPLFVIVTLFGVGLDYDIFLVTRTREAVMAGKSDDDAIAEAINENASVILVLGFILSGVFGSLIFSPIGIISEIGFSITAGVLIDTVISWLFLIPALMLVMEKYNWWPSHIRKGG